MPEFQLILSSNIYALRWPVQFRQWHFTISLHEPSVDPETVTHKNCVRTIMYNTDKWAWNKLRITFTMQYTRW